MYLSLLFKAVFSTSYYGLLCVGEVTTGSHLIRVVDVHIAANKKKLMFILWTSKTHGLNKHPQIVKISSTDKSISQAFKLTGKHHHGSHYCPFHILQEYLNVWLTCKSIHESFFIYSDRSPVTPYHVSEILCHMLKLSGFATSSIRNTLFQNWQIH